MAAAELRAKLKKMEEDKAGQQCMVDGLEKERDFYFNKLRDVEVFLQEKQSEMTGDTPLTGKSLSDQIFQIL